MCGLVGVCGSFITKNEYETFTDLLTVSALRGSHSTGVAKMFRPQYNGPMRFEVRKQAENPITFMEYQEEPLWSSNAKAFVGHTRFATQGKVTDDNAHPFWVDHIIGVHNGTIYGEFDYRKDYETDSEALMKNIAEKGIQAALQHIEDKAYSAAYTVIFIDTRDNTINFIRNDKRTLHFLNTQAGVLYWASERAMIDLCTNRRGINRGKDAKGNDHVIWSLKPNTLYQVPLEEVMPLAHGNIIEEVVKPKVWPIVPLAERLGNGPRGGNAAGRRWNRQNSTWEDVEDLWEDDPDDMDEWEFFPPHQKVHLLTKDGAQDAYVGYEGMPVPAGRYRDLLAEGCVACFVMADLKTKVHWISKDEYICADHKDDPKVMEYIKSGGVLLNAGMLQ